MTLSSVFAFMPAGGIEIVVILALLVVLFWGPSKIPKLARAFGQSTQEFKKGREELEEELEKETNNDDETQEVEEEPEAA